MIGLDVGGYRGTTIPRLINMGCNKIYCLEPCYDLFKICESVAEEHSNENVSIEVINKALHGDGEYILNLCGDGSTLLDPRQLGRKPDKTPPTEKVKGISFTSFIEQYELTHIDVIKMNCEGSEFIILEELLKSGVSFNEMGVQFHSFDDHRNNLVERFIDLGYDVWTHQRNEQDDFVWWSIMSKGRTPILEKNKIDKLYSVKETI